MKSKRVFLVLFLLATINSFFIVSSSQAITITCPETIPSSGSASCTASGCSGTVSWGVTGTGASINNGILTTTSACGVITVAAGCSDGTIATNIVRVDGGDWTQIAECGFDTSKCCSSPRSQCVTYEGQYKYLVNVYCACEDCFCSAPVGQGSCASNCGTCADNSICGNSGSPCIPNCKSTRKITYEYHCQSSRCSTDTDGDGYNACNDCDDTNSDVHPGAQEICDLKDNNCNGQVDEGYNVGAQCTVGIGACQRTGVILCSPDDQTHLSTVCSVTAGDPSPEICDGIDNDCNGQTDEGVKNTYYRDADGDGYGDPNNSTQACTQPAGYITNNTDCNDSDALVYPGATERCDGIDNNCNGVKDEGCGDGGQGGSGNGGGGQGGGGSDDGGQPGGSGGGNGGGSCGNSANAKAGSYVNVTSSNIKHSQPLFRIKGGTMYLDFNLTYNSLDPDGPLGIGWTHTHNVSLQQNNSTEYILKRGYDKYLTLIQNGSEYKPQASAYPILTINPDSSYKLTYKDGIIYNFDTSGKLTSIQDKYSNIQTFAYTGSNLTGITDSQNPDRPVSLTYSNGRIQTITDPNNNVHVFTYQNGYLTGITTQTPDPNDTDPVWSYTYKPYGYMWTKTDPMGNLTEYVYDENDPQHKLLHTIDPETKTKDVVFDPANVTTTITEKDGGVWIYKYSTTTGLLTEKRLPEGFTPLGSSIPQDYVVTYTYETSPAIKETTTDNRGNITEYIYDTNRNLLSVTEKSTTDPVGKTTNYTYDPTTNDILTITDPENHQTIYTYDLIGGERVVKIKDPALEETEYRYYADGRLRWIKNPKNQTTTFTYTYDSVTKKTTETITDFLGVSTKRIYDISGNMIETRDQFDIPTKYEYDSLNRLKYIKDYQNNILSTNEYYADGSLKKVTDANGNWIEYKYNYNGQVTEVKDKLGNTTIYEYGGTGCSSCGGGGDNLVKIIDANLKETKYEYYKNGSRKNQTSPKGLITTYTYDPPGFMASLTDPSAAATTFDKSDLTMTKTDPLGKTTVYEYDKAGRLKNITDRNNKITHYTYTPDGVADTITYDYPNGPVVSFVNDELDRITSMTDSLGTTTYAYDDTNRKLTVTDPNGFIAIYQYDIAGKLIELTYPGNKIVTYTYDQLNRLKTVVNWLNQTATYNYDAAERLTSLSNFNGTIATYGYDNANHLTSLENKKSDNAVITAYDYTLNAVGNITQSIQDEPLMPVFNPETTNYTYNATKTRLLSAGADSFTYDNEGQLASGYGSTYTFDYEHRLKTISGAFNAEYFYDGTGNRLKAVRNGVTTKYVYDVTGNVLAEADSNNAITKYYVHGLGLLALITPSDQVYSYHFNNVGSTIAITDQAQAIVNKYSYDPFGKILNEVEAVPQPFKYVGQYGVMAEPTGFYYMVTRYYDSKAGLFTSEDTIGFEGGDTNLKRYVGNNPILFIDPLGLDYWVEGAVKGEAGWGFHQSVCVGKRTGGWRYCISFGRKPGQGDCKFNCKGHIYQDKSAPGKVYLDYYRKTSCETDKKIKKYFASLIGTPGRWDAIGGQNCRSFSQGMFRYLESIYKD